jgi:hypothetical protein
MRVKDIRDGLMARLRDLLRTDETEAVLRRWERVCELGWTVSVAVSPLREYT